MQAGMLQFIHKSGMISIDYGMKAQYLSSSIKAKFTTFNAKKKTNNTGIATSVNVTNSTILSIL